MASQTRSFTLKTRTVVLLLLGITLVALLARLAALQILEPVPGLWRTESGTIGQNMALGKGYVFNFYGTRNANPLQAFIPPLFPAVNFLAVRLFEDKVLGLSLIHTTLSTLSTPLLFVVAYRLSREVVVGLLAALAFAVYPVLVAQTVNPASLTVNIFLLLAFLALLVQLERRPSLLLAIACGVVLGLGMLARPVFIGLAPIALVWLWLNRPKARRYMLGLSGVILLLAILIVLPWSIRNTRTLGQFVFISTNAGFNLWNGNNPFTTGSGHEVVTDRVAVYLGIERDPAFPDIVENWQPYPLPRSLVGMARTMDEVALNDAYRQAALEFIRDNPDRWLELTQAKLVGFWFFRDNIGGTYEASWTQVYRLVYVALIALAIAGALVARRDWRRYALLYLIFAYYTVVYVAFHVQTRFRWEIEPLLLILAAVAVWAVLERLIMRVAPQKDRIAPETHP